MAKTNDGLTIVHKEFDDLAKIEQAEERELAKARLKALQDVQDSKLDKKRLSAKDARQIADTTTVPFVHVYKCIRDAATEGMSKLQWEVEGWSKACKQRLLDELKLDGYQVSNHSKYIVISW